jgi:hypothetical protein
MKNVKLSLSALQGRFAICRLDPDTEVAGKGSGGGFYSITRTADELSIVCLETDAPKQARCEAGWRCLKLHGPFAFSATGVLASLAEPLARAGVGIFVISTFDTDYLLVKDQDLDMSVAALTEAGHRVE